MIAVRRVGRPIGIRVMRRNELYASAVFRNAVKLGDESHHVGNVFDNVVGDDEIKFVVRERIRNDSQIVNHVSRRARVVVQANRAFVLIRAAADIENFHTLFFIISRAEKLKCKKC